MSKRISVSLGLFSMLAALACSSAEGMKSSNAAQGSDSVGARAAALVGDAGLDAGGDAGDAGNVADAGL